METITEIIFCLITISILALIKKNTLDTYSNAMHVRTWTNAHSNTLTSLQYQNTKTVLYNFKTTHSVSSSILSTSVLTREQPSEIN